MSDSTDDSKVLLGAALATAGLVAGGVALGYFVGWQSRENIRVCLAELEANPETSGEEVKGALVDAHEWTAFKLKIAVPISRDCKLLRFEMEKEKSLNIPVGRSVSVRAEIDDEMVRRPYTPVSFPSQRGYFDLLVKSYDLGKMSQYLHTLDIGDEIEVRGPVGGFIYTRNMFKQIFLIGGGSGLTPLLQVVRAIIEDPEDRTQITLIYQNRRADDILLHNDIKRIESKNRDQLRVVFFLTRCDAEECAKLDRGEDGKYRSGYVDREFLSGALPSPNDKETKILLCGSGGFTTFVSDTLKNDLKFPKTSLYKF